MNESRARQPFFTDDGEVLTAHNGEFYDFQRIRADFTAQEFLSSKSDSEILLRLYQRQGLNATLPLLRGEFAFALFDLRGLSVSRAGSFRDQAPVLGDDL